MNCSDGNQFSYGGEPCLGPFCQCGGCTEPGCIRRCRCERPRLIIELRKTELQLLLEAEAAKEKSGWLRLDVNYATGERVGNG